MQFQASADRRFGPTYPSLLQGSSSLVQAVFLDSLKMGTIGSPETGDYQYTLSNIPEERRSQI